MNGIIGRKLGMTRVYDAEGRVTPVTVIEAGPCPVIHVRSSGGGAPAVELAFGNRKAKRTTRAMRGHVKAASLETAPRIIRRFDVSAGEPPAIGEVIRVDIFEPGEIVKVVGTSKGKGFQGVVKRYGFSGGPASHGNTRHRRTGSLGPGTNPSRVIKGKKMPGHMGSVRRTALGLSVVRVDAERNLLFVRGAVPGPATGIVLVKKQGGSSRYA